MPFLDAVLVDDDLFDRGVGRDIEHQFEEKGFDDHPESSGPCACGLSFFAHGAEGVIGELEVYVFLAKELLVLLDDRVFGCCEDGNEIFYGELIAVSYAVKTADKFRIIQADRIFEYCFDR